MNTIEGCECHNCVEERKRKEMLDAMRELTAALRKSKPAEHKCLVTGVVLCKGEAFLCRTGKPGASLGGRWSERAARLLAEELGVPFSEE